MLNQEQAEFQPTKFCAQKRPAPTIQIQPPPHRTRCSPTHNLKHLNQECQSHKLHNKIAHMTAGRACARERPLFHTAWKSECIAQENQFSTLRRREIFSKTRRVTFEWEPSSSLFAAQGLVRVIFVFWWWSAAGRPTTTRGWMGGEAPMDGWILRAVGQQSLVCHTTSQLMSKIQQQYSTYGARKISRSDHAPRAPTLTFIIRHRVLLFFQPVPRRSSSGSSLLQYARRQCKLKTILTQSVNISKNLLSWVHLNFLFIRLMFKLMRNCFGAILSSMKEFKN